MQMDQPASRSMQMLEHLSLDLPELPAGNDADIQPGQQVAQEDGHMPVDLGFRYGKCVVEIECYEAQRFFHLLLRSG
jgi:hypothetical protein